MGSKTETKVEKVQGGLLKVPFSIFGRVTVALPLFSMIFCFITAILFKFDEVNKTVCKVQNIIPSISAITGVSPQRYIWRICIAIHSTPRYSVGFVYYNYYMNRLHNIAPTHRGLYKQLVRFNFWCYTVENSCLVGVTYIANVENYPLHEKMFVLFMVTSLVYELVTLILFRWCHPDPMSDLEARSYKAKQILFAIIMSCTAGLIYFFLRHRWYCDIHAFSWFSFFEYGIAITNIAFHYSAMYEFGNLCWYIGTPLKEVVTNHHKKE